MRRRITLAIVGVSAVILIVLGVPLAIAVHRSVLDSEVVELQVTAAKALTEIGVPLDRAQLQEASTESDAPPPFSVYSADGKLLFGDGPPIADAAVLEALDGTQSSRTRGAIVVATPITDRGSERIVGALRLTESLGETNHRSRMAWLVMAIFGLAAVALAWLIGNRVARRLSRPITDLAAAAADIGDGAVGAVHVDAPSGIAEIDTLSTALSERSERVNEALARERRFSSDVSHQLRTPLTALRLRLESTRDHPSPMVIDAALDDLARVDETVEHLLAFARDSIPMAATVQLDHAAREAANRWTERISARGRALSVVAPEAIATRGSAASVDQILDVLIDNALEHGRGRIDIVERRIAGGGALDVSDEGTKVAPTDTERIFERGHGEHHGIGLALARSIAEAEGGRLLLTRVRPTTFSLILLHNDQNGDTP